MDLKKEGGISWAVASYLKRKGLINTELRERLFASYFTYL